MARDTTLLASRNKEIRAAYNRLKCEQQRVNYGGRPIYIHLNYQQILTLLSKTYFISKRTVEGVLAATEPKMAPLNPTTSVATPA